MTQLMPIPFLIVTVAFLIRAEFKNDNRQIYFFKPISTALVILVALLSFFAPAVKPMYTWGVVLGLALSMGGDVALMFKSSRTFLVGLVLFLLAHVAYAVVWTLFNNFQSEDLIIGIALLIIGVAFFLYLKPGLGQMQGPVALYILIIMIMVNRAISAFFGNTFTTTQAWLISLGALLFMFSDMMLAANRFRHPFRLNRLSLCLYYGGQLLIALSPSYFAG